MHEEGKRDGDKTEKQSCGEGGGKQPQVKTRYNTLNHKGVKIGGNVQKNAHVPPPKGQKITSEATKGWGVTATEKNVDRPKKELWGKPGKKWGGARLVCKNTKHMSYGGIWKHCKGGGETINKTGPNKIGTEAIY